MKCFLLVPILLALPLHPAGPGPESMTTQQKIDLIESEKAPGQAKINFGQQELNTYVRGEIPKVVPEGVRNARLEITDGKATGYALIDFLKVRHAKGETSGWMLKQLLQGERAVTVVARLQSADGKAQVDVERVEISGRSISGPPLDLLIQMFVLPLYPEAKVGEQFELQHGVEKIELLPAMARVTMK